MSDPATIRRAAAALHAARARPGTLAPLPPALAPADVAAGAAVQHALAELRGDLPPAGFKIGATGARMQAYLGLPGPAAGYMERRRVRLDRPASARRGM
jgi:2-keto-4-pentenoate hydratase